MDIQEMIEIEKRRQQAIQEEKIQAKLRRQIRIFNQEKGSYERKTSNELAKSKRSIGILQAEKFFQLDNFLATQSTAIDKAYRKDEAVVRELVHTTGIVRDLLTDETAANKNLQHQINKEKDKEYECRRKAAAEALDRERFWVPPQDKMDSRVEHANARYHVQCQKNIELQKKIDNALIKRGIFIKEDAKLNKQLDSLLDMIHTTMNEASHLYEERDRNEGTRMKVTEHLAKVKDSYMSEMLTLTTALTEDKELETFMRTKQKDIGGYIREKRAEDKQKVKTYLSQKDEFSVIFDRIKEAIGKNDIREIIQDFVDKETDNYSTFMTIGDLMDDNERLRVNIQEISSDNIDMELLDLNLTSAQKEDIRTVQNRIASLKQQTEQCHKRMEENKQRMDDMVGLMGPLLGILKLDSEKEKLKKPEIRTADILAVLTTIEEAITVMIHDFTMVELSTRATSFSKSTHTPDEVMLMRHPSAHIYHANVPRVTPPSVNKVIIDDHNVTSQANILTHNEAKDYIVKAMQRESMNENGKKSKMKSTH